MAVEAGNNLVAEVGNAGKRRPINAFTSEPI